MQVYCRLEFPQRITWLAVRPLLFCNLANMHCTVRLVLAEPKFVSYKRLDACICSICGLVVSLQCLVDRCHGFGYGSLNALARDGLRRRCLGSLGHHCRAIIPGVSDGIRLQRFCPGKQTKGRSQTRLGIVTKYRHISVRDAANSRTILQRTTLNISPSPPNATRVIAAL